MCSLGKGSETSFRINNIWYEFISHSFEPFGVTSRNFSFCKTRKYWRIRQRKKYFNPLPINLGLNGHKKKKQHFLLSHNVFYTSQIKFNFLILFILSSANILNMDKSKFLLFGKELTHHPPPHNPAFDVLKIFSCGKHCEKRRNCL